MAKIAVLVSDFSGRGVQKTRLTLANSFVNLGHKVDVIVFNSEGSLKSSFYEQHSILELNFSRAIYSLPVLVKIFKKNNYDLIISAEDNINIIAIAALKLSSAKSKISVSTHVRPKIEASRGILERGRYIKFFARLLYPKSDMVIAVSEGIQAEMCYIFGLKKKKIHVIYDPFDLKRINTLKTHELPIKYIKKKTLRFITVGSLDHAKRIDVLLRAFAIVNNKWPYTELYVIGKGPDQIKLQRLAEDLGIPRAVCFVGYQSNPYNFMYSSDVFVLTSDFEGLPGVLIEALKCGCKVVSTNCMYGPSEILAGGEYGLLAEVGNHQDVAKKMFEIIGKKINEIALEKHLQKFDEKIISKKYLRLI